MKRFLIVLSILVLGLATTAHAMLVQPSVSQSFASAFATSEPRFAFIIDSDCGAGISCRNNPIDNVDPLGLQGWPVEYEAARLQMGVGRPDDFVSAFTSGTPEQRAAAVAILGEAQVRSVIQSVELEQARKEAEFQKAYGVSRGQVGEASLNVALLALPVERVVLGGLEYIGQVVRAGARLGRVSLGIRSAESFMGKELAESSFASRPWWRTSLNPQAGSVPNLLGTERVTIKLTTGVRDAKGVVRFGGYDPATKTVYMGDVGHFGGMKGAGGTPMPGTTPGVSMLETETEVTWANDSLSLPKALTSQEAADIQKALQAQFPGKVVRQVPVLR